MLMYCASGGISGSINGKCNEVAYKPDKMRGDIGVAYSLASDVKAL